MLRFEHFFTSYLFSAMSSGDNDKESRVNRASVIRRVILCLFPLVSLLLQNWAGFGISCAISLLAAFTDKLRNQRRLVSFPVFLILVWTIQALCLSLVLSLSVPADFDSSFLELENAELAMEKWQKIDQNIDLSQSDWPEDQFPWIKQFPALAPGDPAPVIKTATVILAAHNEHKYLERTINSIIAESPADQLLEIIVVDDASEPPLSEITVKMNLPVVKVVRQDSREGLIRSKSHGAALARGDLIIFLDAHVKPEPKWLDPLFRHTNENWKRVVVPVIPILNGDTWTVDSLAVGYKMMFDWSLGFNWFDDGDDFVPIMSGGLLAITRRYWHWSGEYDNGMLQWGGENIEQSIRIWLCGGEIVVARDSRVSHVFRPTFPYAINHTQVNVNKVRLVEVWFGNYKDFYYRADTYGRSLVPAMGDLSERLQLKEKLQCKPFQFFVDRFRAVFDMKHMLPTTHFAIKDETSGKCVEAVKTGNKGGFRLGDCQKATGAGMASTFRFIPDVTTGSIRSMMFSSECFDANSARSDRNGLQILLFFCQGKNANQHAWTVDQGGIRWNGHCAFVDPESGFLTHGECSSEQPEFLGKTFVGHKDHRFVIVDEQRTTVATSDKDNHE